MSTFIMSTQQFIVTNEDIKEKISSYVKRNPKNYPPIGTWDVSRVTDMSNLNFGKQFNEDIGNWDVSNVTNMTNMFKKATSFNQPLNNWNVSNVISMEGLFYLASSFNQSLNNWNVSNVTNMNGMFFKASSFNQPLNDWNVSNVTNMNGMFLNATSFNQPLNNWDVGNVRDMGHMFTGATAFNQPLNDWNVSRVTNMSSMFFKADSFNQPLNNWNVVNVRNMGQMFENAISFNQSLTDWNIQDVTNIENMFENANLMQTQNMPRRINMPRREIIQPNLGIAYEVHNAFEKINQSELLSLIGNTEYNGTNFISTIKKFITDIIREVQDESEKTNLQEDYQLLLPKIESMEFHDNSIRNLINSAIEFTKRQPKQYRENYIRFLLNDSCQAYDTGTDTLSCVKGIRERLIFSLSSAGVGLGNVLYEDIARAIYPDPITDQSIYHFIGKCIEEESERLKTLSGNMNEKEQKVLECVKRKIQQSNPDFDVDRLNQRILGMIPTDMLEDDALGGRRRKTKKRKNIQMNTKKGKKGKKSVTKKRYKKRVKNRTSNKKYI